MLSIKKKFDSKNQEKLNLGAPASKKTSIKNKVEGQKIVIVIVLLIVVVIVILIVIVIILEIIVKLKRSNDFLMLVNLFDAYQISC